jgi:hypothetical protein
MRSKSTGARFDETTYKHPPVSFDCLIKEGWREVTDGEG